MWKTTTAVCAICGTTFTTCYGAPGKYCREHSRAGYEADRKKRRKKLEDEKEKRAEAFEDVCARARAAGMSYGQYVAQLEMR